MSRRIYREDSSPNFAALFETPVATEKPEPTRFMDNLGSVDGLTVAAQRKSGSSRIKAGMQVMFDKAKAEGYQAGLSEGRVAGRVEGIRRAKEEFELAHKKEIEKFQLALEAFVSRSEESVEEWYLKSEESLSALAIEIANRAIGIELTQSRESVIALTRQALQEVRHGTEVRIRVNPMDASILESHREEILSGVAAIKGVEVVPDMDIASGCEIETDGGLIDAKIRSFMARIVQEAA